MIRNNGRRISLPLTFLPMGEASARAILDWRYEAPYDLYNLNSGDTEEMVRFFSDPQNAYHAIADDEGVLVAYSCFGRDAQVPGGDYDDPALDIGLGVRPDLTGKGHGLVFVSAVLRFAQRAYTTALFRVTVAEFNNRALRVWEKAGFQHVQTFAKEGHGIPFVVLTRPVAHNGEVTLD